MINQINVGTIGHIDYGRKPLVGTVENILRPTQDTFPMHEELIHKANMKLNALIKEHEIKNPNEPTTREINDLINYINGLNYIVNNK